MNGVEIRMAAVYLLTKLPPNHQDAIAALEEARRLVDDYLFADERLPPLGDGNNSASKSES